MVLHYSLVIILGTPVGGHRGSIWTLTQIMHFPKEFYIKTYSKTLISVKEKLTNIGGCKTSFFDDFTPKNNQ